MRKNHGKFFHNPTLIFILSRVKTQRTLLPMKPCNNNSVGFFVVYAAAASTSLPPTPTSLAGDVLTGVGAGVNSHPSPMV